MNVLTNIIDSMTLRSDCITVEDVCVEEKITLASTSKAGIGFKCLTLNIAVQCSEVVTHYEVICNTDETDYRNTDLRKAVNKYNSIIF